MTGEVNWSIQLYGPSVNHDSWSRVARGMRTGLERLGLLAGFRALEDTMHDLDDGMPAGSDAICGVFIGPPSQAGVLRGHGSHEQRAVMIAANSSWLPAQTMQTMDKAATELLAPSHWAAAVMQGHSKLPVSVWQHGVSDEFQPNPNAPVHVEGRNGRPFLVLHLASTIKERKATRELCVGWVIAMKNGWLPGDAQLHIVLSGPPGDLRAAALAAAQGDEALIEGIGFVSRMNLSEQAAAEMYQRYDLVCQPSRAEGFGLVPLEARCCGVPVSATECTGHEEHIHKGAPGVIVVPHGKDGPVDDGPGAMAPTVDPFYIAESLAVACTGRDIYHRHALAAADELRQRWSWEAVCRKWVDEYF